MRLNENAWILSGAVSALSGNRRVAGTMAGGLGWWALAWLLVSTGCGPAGPTPSGEDPQVTTRGSIEVTARLVEIPEGAIFKRDLYDYATILKYTVLKVHRGQVKGDLIYVAHYDPWKPRSQAADRRVKDIGGHLKRFEAGQFHRLALEVPIDDYFMGGIVNKYFGKMNDPIHWAVWTNPALAPPPQP
jgi:hypothetical protein